MTEATAKKRKKKRKSLFRRVLGSWKWVLPLLIVGGLVVYAFLPKPVEVDIGTVERGPMMLTIDDDGATSVRERYVVAAPLAGMMSRIGLEAGDRISEGETLVTIEPTPPELLDPRAVAQAEATTKAAEASVETARARLEARMAEEAQLEKAYQRSRLLHERGNIADAEMEQAESAWIGAKQSREAAETEVEIAGFEMEQAKAALLRFDDAEADSQFAIRSPVDGQVLRLENKSSRPVQPGELLLEVGDPADLEMRIDVLSRDAVRIEADQRVLVDHWGGDRVLEGRVRLVEPSGYEEVSALGVDEQRVDVLADFANPQEAGQLLGDGYRVEARIVIWESENALQVPTGALFRQGDKWAAYRVVEGRARLTEIEIDHNNGEFAEVVSGLTDGDRVILHPGDSVTEDTMIQPRKE